MAKMKDLEVVLADHNRLEGFPEVLLSMPNETCQFGGKRPAEIPRHRHDHTIGDPKPMGKCIGHFSSSVIEI